MSKLYWQSDVYLLATVLSGVYVFVSVLSGVGAEELEGSGEESVAQLVVTWLEDALQERKFQCFTENVSTIRSHCHVK